MPRLRPIRFDFARRALALTVALVCALSAACARETTPRRVFLITVDTLRADHLGSYGYPRETDPNLAELASDGVLFERAIAQWPKTGPSFASIFTGRYPQTTGLTHKAALRLPDEYLTLAELMKHSGYATAAVVSNGVLAKHLGWDQGFDEYLQTWSQAPESTDDPADYRRWINARKVNELALPLLDRLAGAERVFVWIHYSDPHAPYFLPADVENPFLGDVFDVGDATVKLERPRATALGDRRELRYYVAQYDANIRFADGAIGELLSHARALDLLDDSVVAMTADHGESLGEHDYYFAHGRLPYNQGAHVPLIFRRSAEADGGRRIAPPVELVDLYPTLRDLVDPSREVPGLEGETLVPFLDGESVPEGPDDEPHLAFSQAGGGSPLTHFRSVQDRIWKLIYHPRLRTRRGEEPPSWELYRLDRDPGETVDLVGEETRQVRRLRHALKDWMKGEEWIRRDAGEFEVERQETVDALRALGYTD